MRILFLAALALAALNVASRDAKAEVYYPWCAYYDSWSYNCGFTSFEQCLATTSGVGGLCRQNPYAAYSPPRRSKRTQGY